MASQDMAVAEMLGRLARELLDEPDPRATLQRIVDLANRDLDGCESVGVSLVESRQVTSPASAGDIAGRLDELQSEVGEGPCLDALHKQKVYRTGDLPGEERWRKFSARAYDETGVRSILSIRLFTEGNAMGALNMYSTAPDAFDDDAVAVGTIFATHAAVALTSARREENLEHKADSRDIIGQAKGSSCMSATSATTTLSPS